MLQRLAAWSYRHRRRVLVLWIVALVLVSAIGSSVGSTFTQGFALKGTESQQAADLLEARFPARAGDEGQIVFARDGGVEDPAVEARMEALFTDVAAVPGVTAVVNPYDAEGGRQIARNGAIAYATVQFDRVASKIPDSTIQRIRDLADGADGGGVRVALGGRMFQENGGVGPAELIGILAAIVILLVAFGSLLAMGLPILVALFGIGIGLGFVELLSHVIATPDFATQLASMIGIGVGIDYALFIVTRYRQGLAEGLQPEHAVVRAIDTAGRAVVFAGCTVVISLLGLFLMGVNFVNGMALGTSVTVGVVMLASITLLPAILGFVGRTIDRFSVGRKRVERSREQSLWFRWSRVVQRHPWRAFAGGLTVLVVLAIPLFSMRLAFPDAGGNPTSDTTRQAYDLVAKGFGAGFNGPLVLAAEFPKRGDTRALDALVTRLRKTPDVVTVTEPALSPSGDAAVIRLIPASSPQSASTSDLVDTLRSDVIPASLAGTDVQVHVGGLTASSIDVSDRLASRLPIFIGAVLVLSFLLLMTVFRSLVVPLKAVVMNLLSIGAAYGVVVAIFEWGWLSGTARRRADRSDRTVRPDDDVRDPLRALDGLRGVPAVPHPRGVRPHRRQRGRGGRRARVHGSGHHRGRGHHGDGLRQLRPRRFDDRSSSSASDWRPRSSSTPPSSGWCWCRRRWSCSATATGGCPGGSTGSCPTSTSKARRRSPSPSRPRPTPAVLTTIGSPCPWRDSPTPSGAPPMGRSNVARVRNGPACRRRRAEPDPGVDACAYDGNPRTTSSTRPTTTPTSTRVATTASPTARPASAGGSAWGTGRTRATPR